MKKILYIFLTLSILSTGCSDDDDTIQPITNLDSNLLGIWLPIEGPSDTWTYNFLSDGTYIEETIYIGENPSISNGSWLTENQSLYMTENGESPDGNIPYNIQGDSLTLDYSIINSTPGETYLFIKQ